MLRANGDGNCLQPERTDLLEEWDEEAVDVHVHDAVHGTDELAADEDDADDGRNG